MLLRALSWVSRARFLRALFWLALWFWLVDRAVSFATDAAWFDSIGQSAWWEQRLGAQLLLGIAFWLTFIFSSIGAMRAAAHPLEHGLTAPPLSGALENLESLRARAPRMAWLGLLLSAFVGARGAASAWPQWLAWRETFDPIWALPLAQTLLGALWFGALALFIATAFAGLLRALPFLAKRAPQSPVRLWRALSVLGALVLVLRGAGYVLNAWDALWRDGTSGSEQFVGLPLGIAGAALCIWAAIVVLKRVRLRPILVALSAAFLLPPILLSVLSPFGALLPSSTKNDDATRAAWNLEDAPRLESRDVPLERAWPLWNESTLVGAARARLEPRGRRFIDWRSSSLDGTDAIVTGVPASLDGFGSRRIAENANALEFLPLDATSNRAGLPVERSNAPLPLRSFYGIEGPALLGENGDDAGVPFRSWGWKLAWAWRLRDPILLFDGARSPRLLVFRGARETAEKLAPLGWSEPQLHGVASAQGARWRLIGYDSSAVFHGARAATSGSFAGKNAAARVVALDINPRNGSVEWVNLASTASSAKALSSTKPFAARSAWSRFFNNGSPAVSIESNQEFDWVQAQREIAALLGEPVLPETVISVVNGQTQFVGRVNPNDQFVAANLQARLSVLDEIGMANLGTGEGETLEMGRAVVWPDARAPGGYWLGRTYFVLTEVPARGLGARLKRVALTGMASSTVGIGTTALAAKLDFQLKTRPPESTKTVAGESLELQALRVHQAVQDAARRGDWTKFAQESRRQKQLLEQLAARAAR